jgi:hypothetical protein
VRESIPGAGAAASAPPQAALGLHKGIGTNDVVGGCPRWPESFRLESTLGQLVPGRCRATNLCDYCAKLGAVENAEVLAQDALSNSSPLAWTVLGTRSTVASMAAYKYARKHVRRAVTRRWPDAEVATLVEFTTGYGTRAEGKRRPHWNDLWKGVPAEDWEELRDVAAAAWCVHVDAEPRAQHGGQVNEIGGLMRYLALHFQKENQQPPHGWRGHRFTTTRGYLAEPMEQARERARTALRYRRAVWKVEQSLGDVLSAEEIHDLAVAEVGALAELAWSLVRLQRVPVEFTESGDPATWTEVVLPVR